MIPGLNVKFKNQAELLDKLIRIYAAAKGIELANYERDTLMYYIRYGHSKETREFISEDTGKGLKYISVIDRKLKTKGFLVDDVRNYRRKNLSPDMKKFKDSFVNRGKTFYLINFKKDGN